MKTRNAVLNGVIILLACLVVLLLAGIVFGTKERPINWETVYWVAIGMTSIPTLIAAWTER